MKTYILLLVVAISTINCSAQNYSVDIHSNLKRETDTVKYSFGSIQAFSYYKNSSRKIENSVSHCDNLPIPQITGNSNFCLGDTISLSCATQNVKYLWSNGDTSNTIKLADSATVSVKVFYIDGCIKESLPFVVTLKQKSIYTQNISICRGDSISVFGNVHKTNGTYRDSLKYTADNGCDTIVITNLTIKEPSFDTVNVTICSNQIPYNWNGNNYTTSGTYLYDTINAIGCDSTTILNLTILSNSITTVDASICSNSLPFVFGDTSFSASGNYTIHKTNSVHCDSTIILNLTINQTTSSAKDTTLCPSALPFTWNGLLFTTAGSQTVHFSNSKGCDSATTLNVLVFQNISSTTDTFICKNNLPLLWNGVSCDSAGTYTYHTNNKVGCDSVVTLHLSINNGTHNTTTIQTANTYIWTANGQTYNLGGEYLYSYNNANGCSSIDTLKLTITNTISGCWKMVSAGDWHTVGIKNDGSLWAWGWNGNGQVDGTVINRALPVHIGVDTNWKTIYAGYDYTVAIKTNGTLWAWGSNSSGQLGDGTYNDKVFPTQIGNATNWLAVSAAWGHTIALKTDGTLWAWGVNNKGQLGNGSLVSQNTPVQIGSGNTWKFINAQGYHSAAIKTDGTLWAWGDNSSGQLGDGTTINKISPIQITSSNNWKVVSGGYSHSAAIKTDGTLWTWGDNGSGELGDGTNTPKNTPQQIGIYTNWKIISAGGYYTTAIKSDGTLWTWGWNGKGQLGNGTTTDKNLPQKIGTAANWQSVSTAGFWFTLLLKNNDSLFGCGWNSYGQLGNGTNADTTTPVAIACPVICSSTSSTFEVNACNSYTWNGVTYTTSGTYNKTFTAGNSKGCDSTATLNLIISKSTTSISTITVCSSYVWNGVTYTTSGIYNKTFIAGNSKGCDSSATLNLTVRLTSVSTTSMSICDGGSYSFNGTTYSGGGTYQTHLTNASGCDSIVTLVLTIKSKTSSTNTTTICSGDSIIFNNVIYKTSGTYTAHLTNIQGCDSAAILVLTVLPKVLPTITITTPSTSICVGAVTTFNASITNGGTNPIYQWKKNGNNVGNNSSTYVDSLFNTGDSIWCIITSNLACLNSNNILSNKLKIIVKTLPIINSIVGTTVGCTIGGTNTLKSTTVGGTWASSNSSVCTVSSSGVVTAISNGNVNITYTITGANGCKNSTQLNYLIATVNVPPISGLSNVCVGSSVSLSNSVSGGIWTSVAGRASVDSNGVVTGTSAGTATINYTIMNSYGCKGIGTKNITVNAIPAVPSIAYGTGVTTNPQLGAPTGSFCVGKTFAIVGVPNVPPGAWSATGVASITNAGIVTINTVGTGTIKYTYTSSVGCSSSRTIGGSGFACAIARNTDIGNEKDDFDFEIAPNPASKIVTIIPKGKFVSGKIFIIDVLGKITKPILLSLGTNEIDISNLSRGNYLIKVITESNYSVTKKLIIQ